MESAGYQFPGVTTQQLAAVLPRAVASLSLIVLLGILLISMSHPIALMQFTVLICAERPIVLVLYTGTGGFI